MAQVDKHIQQAKELRFTERVWSSYMKYISFTMAT